MGLLFRKDTVKYHDNDIRKQALKALEDKRLAFANELTQAGFRPETACFSTLPMGGFGGAALCGGRLFLLRGPGPYEEEGAFAWEAPASVTYTTEPVDVPSEGMGGLAGFGKAARRGEELTIRADSGSEWHIRIVSNESCLLVCPRMKCRLTSVKRRHGDSNFATDFRPVDDKDFRVTLPELKKLLDGFAPKDAE